MPFNKKGFLGEEIEFYRKEHRQKLKVLFTGLEELNEVGNVLLEHLRIRKGDLQEITCSSLFLRSMSSFSAGFKLLELGLKADAGTVIRSQVESTIYLKACIENASFCQEYHYSNEIFRLKIVNLFLNGSEAPFEITEENRLTLPREKERLEKLKTDGLLMELNLEVVARNVGLHPMYNTAYRYLSNTNVHSSADSLKEFFIFNKERKIESIVWEPSIEKTEHLIATMASSLCVCFTSLSTVFPFPNELLRSLERRIEAVNKVFQDSIGSMQSFA